MEVSGIGQYPAVRGAYAPQKETAAQGGDAKAAGAAQDSVELSGGAQYLQAVQKQFPQTRFLVGAGFTGERERNTGRWTFTLSPELLEKMSADPEAAGKLEALVGKAEEIGERALSGGDMSWLGAAEKTPAAPPAQGDEAAEEEAGGGDMTGVSGRVGINAGKLARMLAAAKTRAQVQAVIAKIQADLDECEAGKRQGMDVDEASVKAAEQLLQQAKSQLASAEDREATPQEEMASALAALM